jgi:SAM-dependent methyltransferase
MATADLTAYNARTYERMWRYAHYQAPEHTPWWPLVHELAAGARDRLEVGPGPWPKLPVGGTHVVDLARAALEVLAARGALAHHGLLAEVGFSARSFDLVGLFEVLEHVHDDEGLLGEVARLLRPGGRAIIAVPLGMRYWNAFDAFAGHERRYEPEELAAKVERAGLELERFEVRAASSGQLAARLIAFFCRAFPRQAMWLTERVMLAAMRRRRLIWHSATEWRERSTRAGECTIVCVRR